MILSELLHFQEKKYAVSISLEPLHPAFYTEDALKLTPDQYLHHSAFCRVVKSSGNMKLCAAHKKMSMKRAEEGKIFPCICPFGIWELCVPVIKENDLCAVLYSGIFKTEKHPLKIPYGVPTPPTITKGTKNKLRKVALFISDFILTEIEIHVSKNGLSGKHRDENFYIENCKNFINSHYSENIALSDVAERLKLNPNYLGTLLLQKTSMTFRQMLTDKRIAESELLLRLHNDMSISEIASSCGFSDSNYFSSVFSRKTGLAPSCYRKKYSSSKN